MRRLALVLSLVVFLPVHLSAQAPAQSAPAQAPTVTAKDPQAVNIINAVLNAAGGPQAISAIRDYSATGNITLHHAEQDVQGTVTIRSKGMSELRFDDSLPGGIESQVVNNKGLTQKTATGLVKPVPHQPPLRPGRFAFPYWDLAAALKSPDLSVSNKGVVQLGNESVQDICVQETPAGLSDDKGVVREYGTVDYFIDTSTLQVVMMQDDAPKHLPHQVRYSDFKSVSGVLVPFSISEQFAGQQSSLVQLNQVTFNSGLQDADFSF